MMMVTFYRKYFATIAIFTVHLHCAMANENAKRLFDDLMIQYNKLRRPGKSSHEILTIHLRLRLSQIIDVHEKDQIMTTSVWLKQEWIDEKLVWNPKNYGGVDVLYIPAEMIWVPDIVLYNNADSNYNITIVTKATVHHNGTVIWEPPAIYKSMCQIDVQWFPFDEQNCCLKFGSWTFSQNHLDLQHLDMEQQFKLEPNPQTGFPINVSFVSDGIDLCDYYPSVEWDILARPARRHEKTYPSCCPESAAYIDITYCIIVRRKPLFYTVNLIFPCVGISFLTILVFYLPSDSGEKITLCISILVSLTVFFLLLTEIIPATSIVLPLIGKYLLFTMVMVTLSVIVTVIALNLHFRTPTTHRMPKWVKAVFLHTLPRYLFMRRPLGDEEDESFRRVSSRRMTYGPQTPDSKIQKSVSQAVPFFNSTPHLSPKPMVRPHFLQPSDPTDKDRKKIEELYYSPAVLKAFQNVCFIAELLKKKDRDDKIDEDWKYVAMVLDRLFLWIFSASCFFGTVAILLQAPTFYDNRKAIDETCRNPNT